MCEKWYINAVQMCVWAHTYFKPPVLKSAQHMNHISQKESEHAPNGLHRPLSDPILQLWIDIWRKGFSSLSERNQLCILKHYSIYDTYLPLSVTVPPPRLSKVTVWKHNKEVWHKKDPLDFTAPDCFHLNAFCMKQQHLLWKHFRKGCLYCQSR